MKKTISTVVFALLGALAFNASAAPAQDQTARATVSMSQAQATAMKLHPGTIISAVLQQKPVDENEPCYIFNIKTAEVTFRVDIDAETGKVLLDVVEPQP